MIVSIFNDVIGPVMRGPSSSHCAAALRIGREIHPVNVRVGGFYRTPAKRELSSLVEPLERAREQGIVEIVLGMAHRGRLNVLANILKKPLPQIFAEFEDVPDPELSHGAGDVKAAGDAASAHWLYSRHTASWAASVMALRATVARPSRSSAR
mgnify:CR=1 FL=1